MKNDLKRANLCDDWKEIVQDRGVWRCLVADALADINEEMEASEKERKDERKKRREEGVPLESAAWMREEEGCTIVG